MRFCSLGHDCPIRCRSPKGCRDCDPSWQLYEPSGESAHHTWGIFCWTAFQSLCLTVALHKCGAVTPPTSTVMLWTSSCLISISDLPCTSPHACQSSLTPPCTSFKVPPACLESRAPHLGLLTSRCGNKECRRLSLPVAHLMKHMGAKYPFEPLPLAVQVPFRRVTLQDANGHFDLYDTSGPQVSLLHAPHTFNCVSLAQIGAVACTCLTWQSKPMLRRTPACTPASAGNYPSCIKLL